MGDDERIAAIAALKVALEELDTDEGLTSFVEGHGIQSLFFVWRWDDGRRRMDFRLPYARVLETEEEQKDDNTEIAAAIKMAILLLSLGDAVEERIEVDCDEDGTRYSVWTTDGELADSGDDWRVLVNRIEATLPADVDSNIVIIWP